MFPTIPEDRSGLTSTELRALVRELRDIARAERARSTDADLTEEARTASKAKAKAAVALAGDIKLEAEQREADEELDAALETNDDDAEPTVASDDPPVPDPDDPDEPAVPDPVEPASDTTPVLAAVVPVPTGLSTGAQPAVVREGIRPDRILARDGVEGLDAGQPFESWTQVGQAMLDRWKDISPTTDVKHHIATIEGDYPAERKLSETDAIHNMRLLENIGFARGVARELTAALCAPLTPYYGMACENTLRRPVAASLPGFQAPRGGVSIMPSPSLADVTEAGIWTHEDDDADPLVPKPCDEIVCGTPEDFIMYAVYWCLTVKNWHLLTFPELVEAFLNRGLALRARVAERQLLEGLVAGVATITVPALGYGSTVSVMTQVLTYLSLLREEQRFDSEPMVAWGHRWFLDALRIDQSRRRQDGQGWRPATEAEINADFSSIGVDVTWALDTASWMTPPPHLATGGNMSTGLLGTLGQLPSTAELLIAPRGKFAMIDRAAVSIGVTGNNYYTDTTQQSANRVRFFVENYEGVVDTTSCPAHLLEFSGLCHTGVQIADVEIDCDGTAPA